MAEQDMQRIGIAEDDLAMQESRAKRSDQAAAFASWLNSMRMKPDANLPAQLQAAQERRASNIRKNRTVNMLESAGQTELAKQVKSGAITGKTAVAQMFQLAAEERQAQRAAAGRAATIKARREAADLAFEREKELLGLKPSAAQSKVQGLVATGVPENVAMGIVYGRLKVVTDPVTGRTNLFDVASNSIVQSDVSDATVSAAAEAQKDGIFEGADVTKAGGLAGWGANIINKVTDAVGAGQAYPDIGNVQSAMENLSARTTLMLDASFAGRPTNFTREVVRDLTVRPAEIGAGAVGSYNKTKEMVRLLEQAVSGAQDAVAGKTTASAEERRGSADALPSLRGLLRDYRSLENAFASKLNPASSIAVDPAAIDLMNSLLEPQTVNQ